MFLTLENRFSQALKPCSRLAKEHGSIWKLPRASAADVGKDTCDGRLKFCVRFGYVGHLGVGWV